MHLFFVFSTETGGYMKSKCRYCGKETEKGKDFCCDKCRETFEAKTEKDNKRIKFFGIGLAIGAAIMFFGALMSKNIATGAGIIIMGITIIILPYTTPETIGMLGYKKAEIAGRLLGVLLALVGVWAGFLR